MSRHNDCRLVVTDLDGTLLDEDTYDFAPARPALAALADRGIPLVLCSSKTRAEMEPLAARLGLATPLVVENGGALVFPADSLPVAPPGAWRHGSRLVVPLGVARADLIAALPEVADEAGVTARGFATMSEDEVTARTGLGLVATQRAMQREWDEPFLVEGNGTKHDQRLDEAARKRGLQVTRGGRFHHLTGPVDKGEALRALLRLLPLAPLGQTVGLGDSANDLSMLEAVDRPVVMPGKDGGLEPALAAALPGAERGPAPGPAGWATTVLGVLAGRSWPRVDA
ncbi:MAG: HAD-IIB family hydrolase [Acidobacteria bacterium]|nr:HAD-IIB family hydrolase [Acidobacteriota bacterium]